MIKTNQIKNKMAIVKKQSNGWKSGLLSIRRSNSHNDMWIIEDGTGFWNLTASEEYMLNKYPCN